MSGSDWHTNKQKVYNWPGKKSELRPHHDRLAISRPLQAIRKSVGINSGPKTTATANRHDTPATDLRLNCNALRPISNRPTTWALPPRVTCVTRQKFEGDTKIQEWFATNLRQCEWHARPLSELRPICKDFRPQEYPATNLVTHHWNRHVPWPFLRVKSGRGTWRFQWSIEPSYCKYSGVTYDLLVSNIRGTYGLADQLPSNREFGHFWPLVRPKSLGISVLT